MTKQFLLGSYARSLRLGPQIKSTAQHSIKMTNQFLREVRPKLWWHRLNRDKSPHLGLQINPHCVTAHWFTHSAAAVVATTIHSSPRVTAQWRVGSRRLQHISTIASRVNVIQVTIERPTRSDEYYWRRHLAATHTIPKVWRHKLNREGRTQNLGLQIKLTA